MHTRPRISIPLTATDKIIEATYWMLLAALWVYVCILFPHLPDTIPTHMNARGQIDGYGSKNTLWIIPAITTTLVAGLTLINRYPHIFNYPTDITETNASRLYQLATRMLRWLKLAVIIIFGVITFEMVGKSHHSGSSGVWTILLVIALVNVPIAWFLYKAFRKS